jgi:glucokinase
MNSHHAIGSGVLAVDLGGTNLRAGLLPVGSEPADVLPLATLPAPPDLPSFRAVLEELLRQSTDRCEVVRIGLAVPGTADGRRSVWVPKLPYLDGVEVEALVGLPVTVANDAQLALLAEVTAGAAAGRRDVVLFAIGTGIGSAVLSGGRIVRGAHGAACSAGWLTQAPAERGDPNDGWLERHAAGPTFDAVARDLGRPEVTDAASLMSLASRGDREALQALEHPARVLGGAIAAAVVLLDPEAILLAGGVTAGFEVLAPYLREVLERHTPSHLHGVEVAVGRFGSRAGLVGAAIAGDRGHQWTEVDP